MLDQIQVTTIIPSLTALLEHSEFQLGMADAREQFLESYEPTLLTEDEMIHEVEANLSLRVIEGDRIVCRRFGGYSYFYSLGYVFGTINEGLTYSEEKGVVVSHE